MNNKVGVIDKDFNTVISYKYKGIVICKGYSLFVVNNGNKWGVVDLNDNAIIDFKYDEFIGFGDGLFCFRKDEFYGYVDIFDQPVIAFIYSDATCFSNGYGTVEIDDNMWQVINVKGEYVLTDICNHYAESTNEVIYISNKPYNPVTRIYEKIERYYINYNGERIEPKYQQ